jgi:myo-inositol-hexaphosphate 3-phosphohydrolase
VKQYRLDFMGSMLTASFERAFGDTTEAGALLKVESILGDPETGLLFIGDEDRDDVKVYKMDGTFDGRTLGTGVIREDSEGIAILADPAAPEGGYLVVTEQRKDLSRYHVYSRQGTHHLGVVTGDPRIANTDGITIVTGDFGQFRKGALIAVHDDMSVAAYSFGDILESLGIAE